MDTEHFLQHFPEIAAQVDQQTPRGAFKAGYESAVLMILSHERATGHEWVQAMGFAVGRCDDCDDERSVKAT